MTDIPRRRILVQSILLALISSVFFAWAWVNAVNKKSIDWGLYCFPFSVVSGCFGVGVTQVKYNRASVVFTCAVTTISMVSCSCTYVFAEVHGIWHHLDLPTKTHVYFMGAAICWLLGCILAIYSLCDWAKREEACSSDKQSCDQKVEDSMYSAF
jgi:hypothetical protein